MIGNGRFSELVFPERSLSESALANGGRRPTSGSHCKSSAGYAVGILLCPAAGLKSCGNKGLDRTLQPGRGLAPNVIYFGSGRGASRPVEVLKTLAIYRRAGALPLKSSRFVPK